MKVYFINSKEPNCGVYQYGLRMWDSIKHTNRDVQYYEIDKLSDFEKLDFTEVDIIFFNWIEGGFTGPFNWYNHNVAQKLKIEYNITTITIKHTNDFSTATFDYQIDQNYNNSGLVRPLYEYDITKQKEKNKVPTIGSFGFAGEHKGFDDIIRLVNQQYDYANINLHITNAYYGDIDGVGQRKLIEYLKSIPIKQGIKLNITNNFLTNTDILDFVYKNDIIVLAYKHVTDISSLPDYVISTNTPIAVTSVGAFNHVYCEQIDINKHTISEILHYNQLSGYVENLRKQWSQKNMLIWFENLMDLIYEQIRTKTYSQVCQDRFVLNLIGKKGYFLDLGAGWDYSRVNSNTLLLEEWGWDGICVDANPQHAQLRMSVSIRSKMEIVYIPETSIKELLQKHNAPNTIDYLSIDIEPNSIIALENFPFNEYDFKVLTFEHDSYAAGNWQKDTAYEILKSNGYVRLCNNINIEDRESVGLYFEDWWVNPKYFSQEFITNNTFDGVFGSFVVDNLRNK